MKKTSIFMSLSSLALLASCQVQDIPSLVSSLEDTSGEVASEISEASSSVLEASSEGSLNVTSEAEESSAEIPSSSEVASEEVITSEVSSEAAKEESSETVSEVTSEESLTSDFSSEATSEIPSEEIVTSEASAEETITSEESFEITSEASSSEVTSEELSSSEESVDLGDFSITTSDGTYSRSGNVFTISSYGSYTLIGTFVGQIYVDVPETEEGDGTVELVLKGTNISYGENAPIYIVSADEVKIKANKKTTNTITDLRELQSEDDDIQGKGAIYAKCDLKFTGTGSLSVVGTYNNGIHTTKDLKVKNQTLTVQAPNNAIKGNDSITIESGIVTAISTGGDALKTENTDLSSSGKQRGTVTITGGTVNLYAACDGIDAAYDAIITNGVDEDDPSVTTVPTVNILTNKYSSYTGEIVSSSTEQMYLRTSTAYSSSYRYAAYFYSGSLDNGVWADATYKTSMRSGRTTYYYYELERPSSYSTFAVYKFSSSADDSLTNYVMKSSGTTVNTNYDTVTLSERSTSISFNGWSTYGASSQGGPGGGGPGGGPGGWGGEQGNTDKAGASAKGIKAANTIQVSGGDTTIQAHDDGLHANYGDTFDNGSSVVGAGDVLISGGNLTITASDDGVRADRYLRISGGTIKVITSYEALEGNQIYISGGEMDVYSTDDAVNAGNSSNMAGLSPLITVSGGYIFAAVPSNGDVDGFDSNGNYVQTGGTVIVCGPSSQMAAAMDTDGTVSVSGGTLLLFGASERTVNTGNGVTTSRLTGSWRNASYTVTYSNGTTIQTKNLPNSSYSQANSYSVNGSLTSIQ